MRDFDYNDGKSPVAFRHERRSTLERATKMRHRIHAAVVVATLAITVGAAIGSTVVHAARAQELASPATSCSASTACLTESNTLSGPGIKSTSARGNGLGASTDALGSTTTNGASALFGQDLQTKPGNGRFNFGVSGISPNGIGVQGSGGAAGVVGVATSSSAAGLAAESPKTSQSTLLFQGLGYNGYQVATIDSVGNAVFGNLDLGVGGSVTSVGATGQILPLFIASNSTGPFFEVFSSGVLEMNGFILTNYLEANSGDTINAQSDLAVNADLTAQTVTATNYGLYSDQSVDLANITASDSTGVTWLYKGYSAAASKYTIEMGDSGSVYARVFLTMAPPRVVQKTSAGLQEDTYTPQITQPSLEDFGEARLVEGVANVALDPKFSAAIDGSTRYIVSLTPEGDCRGLYVASQSPSGFTVRELQGGRSAVPFNFRIVAKPLGDDSPRLPTSVLPYEFDHKVPPPTRPHSPSRPSHHIPFVNPAPPQHGL